MFLDTKPSRYFFDKDFVAWHALLLIKKNHPAPRKAIDGQQLAFGNIANETQPFKVALRD